MTLLRETLAGERLYQEADTMTTDQNWITAARELLADLVHPEQYGHAVPKDARQRARDLLQEVALPAMGRGPLTDDQIDGLVPMPEPYYPGWSNIKYHTQGQLTAHTRAAVRAALEVQRQEVERLLADAERYRWRPMRTAPKDGTAVLVLVDGSDIPRAVRWIPSLEESRAKAEFSTAGWYMTWDYTRINDFEGPRYWMPCPDDPDDETMAANPTEVKP